MENIKVLKGEKIGINSFADAVVNDLLAVRTFRSKEKTAINLQTVRDWSFAEKAKN